MTKTINPTAGHWAAMLAERKAAGEAFATVEGFGPAYEKAAERFSRAYEALLNARPSDPSVMAAQLRFLISDSAVGQDARIGAALKHVAEQLEALAGGAPVEPERGAVLLSADAAAQVRAALLAVLEHSGGGIESQDDPDLSPGIGLYAQDSERQLRAAIKLLEAEPPAGRTEP
jgi:hypothetical protein